MLFVEHTAAGSNPPASSDPISEDHFLPPFQLLGLHLQLEVSGYYPGTLLFQPLGLFILLRHAPTHSFQFYYSAQVNQLPTPAHPHHPMLQIRKDNKVTRLGAVYTRRGQALSLKCDLQLPG